jgi:predicted extracellular nuclease
LQASKSGYDTSEQGVTVSSNTTVNLSMTQTVSPSGTGVIINQFRTRGPNGADDEFIELRNDSSSAVDISGWRIEGSNSSGTTATRRILSSGISLGPGCHYLLGNSNTGGFSGAVDDTYGVGITDDGGIALAKPDGTIVDAVGMSSGSSYKEGTPLATFGTTNSDRSYKRTGTDTNRNSSDFSMTTPSTPKTMAGSCSARFAPEPQQ